MLTPKLNRKFCSAILGFLFAAQAHAAGEAAFPVGPSANIDECRSPGRRVECFDFDWKYQQGDFTDAQAVDFKDNAWQIVQLPHDAAISRALVNKSDKGSRWNGFVPRSIGWYRKSFMITNSLGQDRLVVEFGGIYRAAEVWLNGAFLKRQLNGYLDFAVDLTDHLRPGKNILAVRYDNTSTNSSRWYTGEGIYRHVKLERLGPLHVERDGQFISTPEIGVDLATVRIETELRSHLVDFTNAEVVVEIRSPAGKVVATRRGVAAVPGNKTQTIRLEAQIEKPALWDNENPQLYIAHTTINVGNATVDEIETPFGIRKLTFSPEHGLMLNGHKMFLKGVNLHDDLGAIGTAAFDRAIERRLETMKRLGVNAVRMSHNPHARYFLDTCDRLGLLVFDEAYDKWSNQYYGSDEDFNAHWHTDLEAFVRRDRNHPSVFIWSVGNEPEGQQVEGQDTREMDLLPAMISVVKSLDPTRPVTAALYPARRNGIKWNQKGYGEAPPHQLAFLQDIASVNYQSGFFARDHKDYPQMIWLLSEASMAGWGDGFFTYDHEPIVGQFYWGGTDYLGECEKWPQRGWYRGILELTDYFKPSSYYIQSFYSPRPMIHIAVFNSAEKSSEVWNDVTLEWQDMYDEWNFKPGETLDVATFSNAEEVELVLNGRSLGIKRMSDCPKRKMTWKIRYEPGELKAIARTAGNVVVAEHVIKTAGNPSRIELQPDRVKLKANGLDLTFIEFKVVDARGVKCPVNAPVIRFNVAGPGVNAGVANGNMFSLESYQADQRSPWLGNGLLVVRSTRQTGEITVTATADPLEPATVVIRSSDEGDN